MDLGRVIKWVLIAAVLFVAWKVVVPWVLKETGAAKSRVSSGAASDNSCVRSAEEASETWGRGLGRFVNPPYDLAAWSTFRGEVEAKISESESLCGCVEESCVKTRAALGDLRALVLDLDGAITTGGSPPGDVVQRQESIDNRIAEASDLMKSGK